MNPSEKSKISQAFITVALLVVLLVLVGGYIYYGMYQAKQLDVVTEETTNGLVSDDERKMNILNELAKDAPTSVDTEERQRIIDALEKDSAEVEMSEERRVEILNALNP